MILSVVVESVGYAGEILLCHLMGSMSCAGQNTIKVMRGVDRLWLLLQLQLVCMCFSAFDPAAALGNHQASVPRLSRGYAIELLL